MEVRLDTYLWAIRMCKTRSLASNLIKSGKVKLGDLTPKASRVVKVGDVYTIQIAKDILKIIEVLDLIDKRMSFEKVQPFYKDLSPKVEKEKKLEDMFFRFNISTKKGSGRPTKKDRRDLGEAGDWFN